MKTLLHPTSRRLLLSIFSCFVEWREDSLLLGNESLPFSWLVPLFLSFFLSLHLFQRPFWGDRHSPFMSELLPFPSLSSVFPRVSISGVCTPEGYRVLTFLTFSFPGVCTPQPRSSSIAGLLPQPYQFLLFRCFILLSFSFPFSLSLPLWLVPPLLASLFSFFVVVSSSPFFGCLFLSLVFCRDEEERRKTTW